MIHFISLIHFSAVTMYKTENKVQLKTWLYKITLFLGAGCIEQKVGIIPWQLAEHRKSDEFLHYVFTVISSNKFIWDPLNIKTPVYQ